MDGDPSQEDRIRLIGRLFFKLDEAGQNPALKPWTPMDIFFLTTLPWLVMRLIKSSTMLVLRRIRVTRPLHEQDKFDICDGEIDGKVK